MRHFHDMMYIYALSEEARRILSLLTGLAVDGFQITGCWSQHSVDVGMRKTGRIYSTAETLRAQTKTNEDPLTKKVQNYVVCEGKEFFYRQVPAPRCARGASLFKTSAYCASLRCVTNLYFRHSRQCSSLQALILLWFGLRTTNPLERRGQ